MTVMEVVNYEHTSYSTLKVLVQQYSSNGTAAQKWIVTKQSNGLYTIHSALNRELVLDVSGASTASGANIQIWSSNNTVAQQWKFMQ